MNKKEIDIGTTCWHGKKLVCIIKSKMNGGTKTYECKETKGICAIRASKLVPVKVGDKCITTGRLDDNWAMRVFKEGTEVTVIAIDQTHPELPIRVEQKREEKPSITRWIRRYSVKKA